MSATVTIELPSHLCRLANVERAVKVTLPGPVTQRHLLDALETQYPMLQGTLRDHVTGARRPFIRFFACGEDLSLLSPDDVLPEALTLGGEPFLVIGAIAGG